MLAKLIGLFTSPQLLASAALFIAIWAFLNNTLFKRLFQILELREARTVGDEHDAVEKRKEARALDAKTEEVLRKSRLDAIVARDAKIQEAKLEAQKLIDRATQTAADEIKKAHDALQTLKSQAANELPHEADKLADAVVQRVLQTHGQPTVH